jgi:hypothetical protein
VHLNISEGGTEPADLAILEAYLIERLDAPPLDNQIVIVRAHSVLSLTDHAAEVDEPGSTLPSDRACLFQLLHVLLRKV